MVQTFCQLSQEPKSEDTADLWATTREVEDFFHPESLIYCQSCTLPSGFSLGKQFSRFPMRVTRAASCRSYSSSGGTRISRHDISALANAIAGNRGGGSRRSRRWRRRGRRRRQLPSVHLSPPPPPPSSPSSLTLRESTSPLQSYQPLPFPLSSRVLYTKNSEVLGVVFAFVSFFVPLTGVTRFLPRGEGTQMQCVDSFSFASFSLQLLYCHNSQGSRH